MRVKGLVYYNMVFIRTDMEEYRNEVHKSSSSYHELEHSRRHAAGAGTVDAQAESENYVFVYSGVKLIVNTEIDDSKFSEDDYEVYEVESCAGQGMTKEYVFKGGSIQVETFTGSDVISRIALCDDTVTTAEGIYIGQTIDDVKAAYGEPTTTTEVMYTYVKGSSDLRFYFDGNGKITQIQYFATGI